MKNKLNDLNNHLFAQLERLGDEGLSADDLKKEIERGAAVVKVSGAIISNAQLALDAEKFKHDFAPSTLLPKLPPMIDGGS